MNQANPPFSDAVRYFWNRKKSQAKKGVDDQGTRASVTGGKHMDGFIKVISKSLRDAGVKRSDIYTNRSNATLPGFFRPTKEWDLVVIKSSQVLAAIELKSQVGSFGNNFNNHAEEAIGNSEDLWTAFREGSIGQVEPFLGYIYLIQNHPKSLRPVRVLEPHWPVMPEFMGSSYSERLAILCRKLVLERKYSAACPLIADPDESRKIVNYTELDPDYGVDHFLTQMTARVGAHY